jgi:hypothetical protein
VHFDGRLYVSRLVSNFGSGPNTLRLTYADCDFTRYKIPSDQSLNLSGAAPGRPNSQNPDGTITVCLGR